MYARDDARVYNMYMQKISINLQLNIYGFKNRILHTYKYIN